jgi:uncharacterized LabA/DUF88 family protein
MLRSIHVDVSRNFGALMRREKEARINYSKYLEQAIDGDRLHKAYAYGVRVENEADEFIKTLHEIGYEVKYKEAKNVFNRHTGVSEPKVSLTSNNLVIAMDVVRVIDKVDTIVIGSNDRDLVTLIDWIHYKGVNVFVYALMIPAPLKEVADWWEEISDEIIDYHPLRSREPSPER